MVNFLCLRYYNNIIYITLYAVIGTWKNFTTEYGVLEKNYIRIWCVGKKLHQNRMFTFQQNNTKKYQL